MATKDGKFELWEERRNFGLDTCWVLSLHESWDHPEFALFFDDF